jgi:hypothetical protein
VLWLTLDHSIEHYELVVASNRKLCSERDQLKIHCNNLQAELVQARSDAEKGISNLEAKVASVEAYTIEIATEGEKSLRDFQGVPARQLERLHECMPREFKALEVCVQSIRGLCLMPKKDERRCEFGICLPHLVMYLHFDDFVNFGCPAQASQLFKPTQASSPHLIVTKPRAGVVDVSSSDTEDM